MKLENLTKDQLLEVATTLETVRDRYKYNFVDTVFPDEGPLRRELYPQHMAFMDGGGKYNERLFSAANQIGKTLTLLLEGYYHASGRYPKWWTGRRFKRPTIGIFGAESWEHIRAGIQAKLLTGGDRGYLERGCGIIPKSLLDKAVFVAKGNPSGVFSEIDIPHVTGGYSKMRFRTYDRQETWESMTVDWVLLDEEPPMDIYTEAAIRTLAKNGLIAIGFTPDSGLTDTVLSFFREGEFSAGAAEGKLITMVGWDDVPHLTTESKARLLAQIPEHLRDAKTKGIPYLGSGRVFQLDLKAYVVDPFKIPDYYLRVFSIDPGITNVAILWGAIDPDSGVLYVNEEYLGHNLSIYTVCDIIKAHGKWIPGVMDPFYGPQASRVDASKVIDLYKASGLDIELCDRHGRDYKEGGIEMIKVALLTGKLKIFRTCRVLINQLNLYHRTDTGKTGRTPDDLVDAIRYLVTNGRDRAVSIIDEDNEHGEPTSTAAASLTHRNKVTGY